MSKRTPFAVRTILGTTVFVLLSAAAGIAGVTQLDLAGGDGNAAIDQYQGIAGGGWNGPWALTKFAGGTMTAGVIATSPMDGGGNYLSVVIDSTRGTVSRNYNSEAAAPALDHTQPHVIQFKHRLDSIGAGFNSGGRRVIVYDSTGTADSTGGTNSWLVGVDNTGRWYGQNSTSPVYVPFSHQLGTVYTVTVAVRPGSRSYDAFFTDGTNSALLTNLSFRTTTTAVGTELLFGHDSNGTPGGINGADSDSSFSLDAIRLSATAAKSWNVAGPASWFGDGNWSPAGAPSLGDTVTVGNGGTADIGAGPALVGTLILDGNSTITGTTGALFAVSPYDLRSGTIGAAIGALNSAVNKTTAGTVVLSGNNAYSGATSVNAGVLNIRHANALGATSAGTTVAAGAALEIQGGIVTAAEALTLNGTGVSDGGTLRSISGDNTFSGPITLGSNARINSDSGLLTLNSATAMGASGRSLTLGGSGNLRIDSAVNLGSGTLTKDGSGQATLTGVGDATTVYVEAGTLQLAGSAAFTSSANFYVGSAAGSNGTLRVTDSASLLINTTGTEFKIGVSGTGKVVQSGGTVTQLPGGAMYLGHNAGSSGTYEISGGTLDQGSLSVGLNGGIGSVVQTGGLVVAHRDVRLGRGTLGDGSYRISSGTFRVLNDGSGGNGALYIGHEVTGRGAFVQDGGLVEVVGPLTVSNATTTTGSYDFNGGELRTNQVGTAGGTRSFTWSGGTLRPYNADLTINGSLPITFDGTGAVLSGLDKDGTARTVTFSPALIVGATGVTAGLTLDGGTIAFPQAIVVGQSGTGNGTIIQNRGSVSTPQQIDLGYAGAASTGRYELHDGSLTVGAWLQVGREGRGEFVMTDGTLNVNRVGNEGLNIGAKSGSSGLFDLSGGTVNVPSSLAVVGHQGIGRMEISGGTLNAGGGLRIGTSGTGHLKIVGDDATITAAGYSQNALSTLELDVDGGISPIEVTGTISLAGFLDVELLSPATAGQWAVLLNDGSDLVSGAFAGLIEGAEISVPGAGFRMQLTYRANLDSGLVGNDVALLAVPEPAAWALALSAFLILLVGRRAKHS